MRSPTFYASITPRAAKAPPPSRHIWYRSVPIRGPDRGGRQRSAPGPRHPRTRASSTRLNQRRSLPSPIRRCRLNPGRQRRRPRLPPSQFLRRRPQTRNSCGQAERSWLISFPCSRRLPLPSPRERAGPPPLQAQRKPLPRLRVLLPRPLHGAASHLHRAADARLRPGCVPR